MLVVLVLEASPLLSLLPANKAFPLGPLAAVHGAYDAGVVDRGQERGQADPAQGH